MCGPCGSRWCYWDDAHRPLHRNMRHADGHADTRRLATGHAHRPRDRHRRAAHARPLEERRPSCRHRNGHSHPSAPRPRPRARPRHAVPDQLHRRAADQPVLPLHPLPGLPAASSRATATAPSAAATTSPAARLAKIVANAAGFDRRHPQHAADLRATCRPATRSGCSSSGWPRTGAHQRLHLRRPAGRALRAAAATGPTSA